MEEYGAETMTADPANMDFDPSGAAQVDEETNRETLVDNSEDSTPTKFNQDGTGTKIDYSNVAPV